MSWSKQFFSNLQIFLFSFSLDVCVVIKFCSFMMLFRWFYLNFLLSDVSCLNHANVSQIIKKPPKVIKNFTFHCRIQIDTDEGTYTKASWNEKALEEAQKVVINFRLCFVYLHPHFFYHVEEVTAQLHLSLLSAAVPLRLMTCCAHKTTPTYIREQRYCDVQRSCKVLQSLGEFWPIRVFLSTFNRFS